MFSKKNFFSKASNNPQPNEILIKFRNRVQDLGCTDPPYDDSYLLRFLRARKFDLEKTTQMWVNFINWRKENNIDQILKRNVMEISEAKSCYPHTWFRTDKQGRPIFIECFGKLNPHASIDKFEMYFVQNYEKLLREKFPACSKARGEPINTTCHIVDLKGAGANLMSQKLWEIQKILYKIAQDYYPEILGDMFIINAPLSFCGIWSLIKPFINEKTRAKIHILGSNYHKELLKFIDENDLPDFLGGKVTIEEYGPNLIHEQGPWVIKRKSSLIQMELKQIKRKNSRINVERDRPSVENAEDRDELESRKTVDKTGGLNVLDDSKSDLAQDDFDELDIGQECIDKQIVKNFQVMYD